MHGSQQRAEVSLVIFKMDTFSGFASRDRAAVRVSEERLSHRQQSTHVARVVARDYSLVKATLSDGSQLK